MSWAGRVPRSSNLRIARHFWADCGIRVRMYRVLLTFVVAIGLGACATGISRAEKIAPTPPLGWNSWDAYGLTIDETDYRANTEVLVGLKEYGWQYSVIDEGWYMQDPF